MIVGFNDVAGEPEVLGSGFLIATQPDLIALTATHVIVDFVNRVRPSATHTFREDFGRRLDDLVQKHHIRAIVLCRARGGVRLCKIDNFSIPHSPMHLDISCLMLRFPRWAVPTDFETIAIDVDPYPLSEPVIMAGCSGGSWTLPELEDHPFKFTKEMVVRAALNSGLVCQPHGMKGRMFQVNGPTEHGMSGGPLLAIRKDLDSQRIITPFPRLTLTAIGVISKDCLAPTILVDGSDKGETLVSPMEDAFLLKFPHRPPAEGMPPADGWFADAVRLGRVRSYGRRALSGRAFLRDGDIPTACFGL